MSPLLLEVVSHFLELEANTKMNQRRGERPVGRENKQFATILHKHLPILIDFYLTKNYKPSWRERERESPKELLRLLWSCLAARPDHTHRRIVGVVYRRRARECTGLTLIPREY